MARIFTLLAYILAINLFIPFVNAYSPFSSTATTQVVGGLDTPTVIKSVGCVTSTSGRITSVSSTTLTDITQKWGSNSYSDAAVTITSGIDKGDVKTVSNNTQTTLTLVGKWAANPVSGDTYLLSDTCSASVSGGFTNTILGPIVNTILVFGNFFAGANFLVQLAKGVIAPGFYILTWLGGANYPPAVAISGIYQAIVWIAYGYGFFYILSGRFLEDR